MIQSELQTDLDARTRLGSAFTGEQPAPPQGGTPAPRAERSPWLYAGALTAAYLLRREIFGPTGLSFFAGFLAAKQIKTGKLPKVLRSKFGGLVREQATFTINKPAAELYDRWHAIENAPQWMESIRGVTVDPANPKLSHWVMDLPSALPGGATLEWDAEWTAEEPGKRLAWRTIGDPQVPAAGQISFEPAASGRGTVMRVVQEMVIPGGKLAGAMGALVSRTPGGFVRENLRHFKQLAEAGEVATTKGQPVGTRGTLTAVSQALQGDREQQVTSPATGTIEHAEVA